MRQLTDTVVLVAFLLATPLPAGAEEAATGTLSLVTNPQVMVYLDGQRAGMSPIINRRLPVGTHRVSLLLILPNGNRLRADYDAIIAADRETMASLNLVTDAPAEGEVRRLEPPPLVAPPPPPPTPPTPPATATSEEGGSWATSPGRPRTGPVTMAEIEPAARPTPPARPEAPPEPPPPQFGLTREMVREGMEAMRPAIRRCLQGGAGLVQVRLNIQPDGGVDDVEVQGAYRGTGIAQCIEAALPEEAGFPIYTGDPIPVVYPYRVVPE